MTRTSLLWLVVSYRNQQEVARFVDKVDALGSSDAYGWAVCDNSPAGDGDPPAPSTPHSALSRPDNPGYLEGGLAGLDRWLAESGGEIPDWVVLTNTDLDVVSGDPLTFLRTLDPDAPLVIAPRITEGPERRERNPHLDRPRSQRRLLINRVVAWTSVTTMVYLWLSRLRAALLRRESDTTKDGHPGQVMFAPYGACIFFSRGFLRQRTLKRNAPLMTEEFYVGLAAQAARAPVVYQPEIHLHHAAHQTTGGKISWQRAKLVSQGFKVMHREVASEGGAP